MRLFISGETGPGKESSGRLSTYPSKLTECCSVLTQLRGVLHLKIALFSECSHSIP